MGLEAQAQPGAIVSVREKPVSEDSNKVKDPGSDASVGRSVAKQLPSDRPCYRSALKHPMATSCSTTITLHEDSLDLWNSFLTETNGGMVEYFDLTADNFDFDPIPYNIMAAGTAVDADNESVADFKTQNLSNSNGSHNIDNPYNVPSSSGLLAPASLREVSMALDDDDPSLEIYTILNDQNPKDDHGFYKNISSSEIHPKVSKTEMSVGHRSVKMMPIHRMIAYLEESNDPSKVRLAKKIRTVTSYCITNHDNGVPKFFNLPGSIFEGLVHVVGGPAFLTIYKASLTYNHPRLDRLQLNLQKLDAEQPNLQKLDETQTNLQELDDPQANLQKIDAAPNEHLHNCNDTYSISASGIPTTNTIATGYPSILQVAVGYGFYASQKLIRAGNTGTFDNSNKNNVLNVKHLVNDCARIVFDMDECARLAFLQKHIDPQAAASIDPQAVASIDQHTTSSVDPQATDSNTFETFPV